MDELIGLARGLCADGSISEADVACLQSWLAAQAQITDHPMRRALLARIEDILAGGVADTEERAELFETLRTLPAMWARSAKRRSRRGCRCASRRLRLRSMGGAFA